MSEFEPPSGRRATPEEEDFGAKYAESNPISVALLNRYFEAVQKLTDSAAATTSELIRAMEIGCGEGHSTARLRGILPPDVSFEASEFVSDQVVLAQANNPGLTITNDDVYDLQRDDESLDLVYLLEVLEHLDDPRAALSEIARVLRPAGFLILGVPREPLWRVLNMSRLRYLRHWGNTPGHLQHWSAGGVTKFIGLNFGPVVEVTRPVPWTILLARKR